MTLISEIIPFGQQEKELSKQLKQLYCIHKYNNPLKKINFKEFVNKIKYYAEIYDFEWEVKYPNGRKHYPKYDKPDFAKDWKSRYDYDGAYKVYANYMNDDESELLLIGEKKYRHDDLPQLILERSRIKDNLESLEVGTREFERAIKSYNLLTDVINELLGIKIDKSETIIKDETESVNPKFKPEVVEGVRDILSRRRNK